MPKWVEVTSMDGRSVCFRIDAPENADGVVTVRHAPPLDRTRDFWMPGHYPEKEKAHGD